MTEAVCDLCGAKVNQVDAIELEGRKVCVDCKPEAVQRLKEGLDVSDAVEELKLASRGKRFIGALLDGLIAGGLNVGLCMTLGLISFSNPAINNNIGNKIVATVIGFVIFFLINGYLLAFRSQTVGKFLLRMKIVRSNGDRISFGRIVGLRLLPLWAIAQIPLIGGVFALVDALMIFRAEKNCLHDDFADSRVVDLD